MKYSLFETKEKISKLGWYFLTWEKFRLEQLIEIATKSNFNQVLSFLIINHCVVLNAFELW